MQHVRLVVTTDVVDLTRLSLTELRSSDDPMLLRWLPLIAGRAKCNRTGVLQNQPQDEP